MDHSAERTTAKGCRLNKNNLVLRLFMRVDTDHRFSTRAMLIILWGINHL